MSPKQRLRKLKAERHAAAAQRERAGVDLPELRLALAPEHVAAAAALLARGGKRPTPRTVAAILRLWAAEGLNDFFRTEQKEDADHG